MSKSVSGAAAYQQLQAPDNSIGQAAQYWGGQLARRGVEDRARKERGDNRKRKELNDWNTKYGLNPEDFESKYTGFKSFDQINTDFSQYATDKYIETNRLAREALESGNLREKNRLEGEMIKLKSDFDLASQSQEFFAKQFEDFKTASQEGTISGSSKEYENIMQAAFLDKNIAIRHDDRGNLMYTGTYKDDEGEQVPFEIPYQDLMDGSFSWNEKQNLSGKDGLTSNILNDLGKITTQREDGLFSITEQAWDDKLHGAATDKAIEAYMSNDSIMGDLLYQLSGSQKTKMRGFDEEDYNTVKSGLRELVRAGYDEEFTRKFDSGRAANSRGWAALNKKDAKKPASKEERELGVRKWNISQVTDNNDVSFFNAGDFKWNGKNHEAIDAQVVGGQLVVTTSGGGDNKITVPLDNETAINDLFNAYEGKTTKFQDVQSVDPLDWREERQGEVTDITKAVEGEFDGNDNWIGDDDDFAKKLRKLYPQSDIKAHKIWDKNSIKINGVDVDLSQTRSDVESDLMSALGIKSRESSTMSDDDFNSFLIENGL